MLPASSLVCMHDGEVHAAKCLLLFGNYLLEFVHVHMKKLTWNEACLEQLWLVITSNSSDASTSYSIQIDTQL